MTVAMLLANTVESCKRYAMHSAPQKVSNQYLPFLHVYFCSCTSHIAIDLSTFPFNTLHHQSYAGPPEGEVGAD